MNFELLAGLSWTPGFRGLLSVLVGVVVQLDQLQRLHSRR